MERATLSDILREVKHAPELHDRLARIVYNLGGGRVPFVFTTAVSSPIVTTTEFAVLTTPPINPGVDSAVVLFFGFWTTTALSAAVTSVNAIVRRGTTIAGLIVNQNTLDRATASAPYTGYVMGLDTPGAVAGQQYTLSAITNLASGNTVVNAGFLIALALG
jgi:hypothetical protein